MRIKFKRKAPSGDNETPATLQDVLQVVEGDEALSVTRRRTYARLSKGWQLY
jgi:hypothetical protein